MVLPAAPYVPAASVALNHVCAYDAMRLETYRFRQNLHDRIQIRHFGDAVALRFDDVGYFNRVYCAGPEVYGHLAEIENLYQSGPFGCELVGPPGPCPDAIASRPGWVPATRYAWLVATDCHTLAAPPAGQFEIRPVQPAERELYLRTYLRAFDAQPDRIPAALRNMRHLFEIPALDFMLAWARHHVAGVGSMMRSENSALLCAGATLPEFRERGCHTALLGARITLARRSGCRQLFSWALSGGTSQANMERAGLETLGVTQSWRLSAGGAA